MNQDLSDLFRLIAAAYKVKREQWRSNSYQTAANVIASFPEEIVSVEQVRDVEHIGDSIITDIGQYLDTGKIQRIHDLLGPEYQAMVNLMEIYGVGPVTAQKLYQAGARTVDDVLADAYYDQFLTQASIDYLPYYHDLLEKIPRQEVDIIEGAFREAWADPLPGLHWGIAGSYRRGEPLMGDVDIVVENVLPGIDGQDVPFTLAHVLDPLYRAGLIYANFTPNSAEFFRGVLKTSPDGVAHRLDIHMTPKKQWGAHLLYFTGSQQVNIIMRTRAKELGYTLNQKGLYLLGYPFEDAYRASPETEEEFFTFLGYQYLTPEQRHRNILYIPQLNGEE